ncbi:Lrp/AsnC family transcriptional regulator [Plantactinospora sp. KBS50]|uniref:Lrp/AsnC family transcriptional regulator n=1 Tax=Plantactinospora sp. KBS50 TaxID=2024580 RepID=UPI000BAB0BCD|nr:Lrp/AsnC family transcriptional regulator [Plantactinospora sp. KBS50]ASW57765.1 AsnC family protein [Plantactinospora sp. KBS50]
MTSSVAVDALDRRVLAALQLDGRAPWGLVARAVGASESTVQRRFNALRARGAARVIGVVDVLRCGLGVPVLVRVSCRPGAAGDVAAGLATRPETRFAALVTGSIDAVAELVVPTHRDLARVLVHDLPGPDGVTDTETLTVMRTFVSAHDWDTGLLDPAAAALLRPAPVRPFEDQVWERPPDRLDDLELAILHALGEDGRLPVREIAAQVGSSESTVARRIDSMVERGCLRFRTLVEPTVLGFAVEFMLWLDVEPARLDAAGRQLAQDPATKYLSATAGRFNLCAQISLRHFADLYRFSTDVVGALPGVRRADTTLQIDTLKRAWTPTPAQRPGTPVTERSSG